MASDADKRRARKRAWEESHREERTARRKARYAANREAAIAATDAWRKENRDRVNANRRARYAASPEPRKIANRAWHQDNREKVRTRNETWRTAHPERKEAIKAWKQKNMDKVLASNRRRRARLQDSCSPGVAPREWSALVEHYGGHCAYCGANATTIDHVVPIAKGGRDEIGNVLPACASCNCSKSDRDLDEWLAAKGFSDPRKRQHIGNVPDQSVDPGRAA